MRPAGVAEMLTSDPVPLNETVCGAPPALSVIVRVPVRLPDTVGVKVTATLQAAAGARLAPQVLVWAKSPEAATEAINNAAWPELVKVTFCAALVEPVFCEANVKLAGDTVTEGVAAVTVTDTAEDLAEAKLASPA